MADIMLNFINNSNDTNNSKVVIFQQNVDSVNDTVGLGQTKIVHKVISNCTPGNSHAFNIPASIPSVWVATIGTDVNGKMIENMDSLTQLSLQGIASADIIMTGGGPGESASFNLDNVERV